MIIELKSTDQNWNEETTTYTFTIDGEQWGLLDNNGDISLLDESGEPVTISQKRIKIFEALCLEVDKINN